MRVQDIGDAVEILWSEVMRRARKPWARWEMGCGCNEVNRMAIIDVALPTPGKEEMLSVQFKPSHLFNEYRIGLLWHLVHAVRRWQDRLFRANLLEMSLYFDWSLLDEWYVGDVDENLTMFAE